MKKNEKGFTLVELMIVVAIIAVLAAIALPALGVQIKKSKDGKAVAVIGTVRTVVAASVADLEGHPINPAHFKNVLVGANENIQSLSGTVGAKVKAGVDKWDKTLTCTVNAGTANAGTPEQVNYYYLIDGNDEGRVVFNEANAVNDTKKKQWNLY